MKTDGVVDEESKHKIINYKIPLGSLPDQELPTLFNYTEQVLVMLNSEILKSVNRCRSVLKTDKKCYNPKR